MEAVVDVEGEGAEVGDEGEVVVVVVMEEATTARGILIMSQRIVMTKESQLVVMKTHSPRVVMIRALVLHHGKIIDGRSLRTKEVSCENEFMKWMEAMNCGVLGLAAWMFCAQARFSVCVIAK